MADFPVMPPSPLGSAPTPPRPQNNQVSPPPRPQPLSQKPEPVMRPTPPMAAPIRTMQTDLGKATAPAASNIFTAALPEQEPIFTPETENLIPDGIEDLRHDQKSKRWLWLSLGIVVLAGLAATGYFVVYPRLQNVGTGTGSEAPTASETPAPAPAPVLAVHTSAFVLEPSNKNTIAPSPLDPTTIAALLKTQGEASANKAITEIIIMNAGGQIPFATYLSALLPSFLDAALASTWLEDDFTAYIYKDEKGIWPGYISKLKVNADQSAIGQWLASLETNDLANFFVDRPGNLAAFKNGTYKNIADRYATGPNGASFSYAIINGYLVINTSFDGLKEAVRLLGL